VSRHTYTNMRRRICQHITITCTLTQTTLTLLYSGGRLIEGYDWAAGDERLSIVTCSCAGYSPPLLALTPPTTHSSSSLLPLSVFIQSPVKMCSHADTYNLINSTHRLYCSASSLPISYYFFSICKHFL